MVCKRCKSMDVSVQAVPVVKKRGILSVLFIFVLLLIPFIGWGILIYILLRGRKSGVQTMAICQNCGHKWKA